MSVVLETTLGAVTLDLYTEVRPQLSKNFLKLCKTKYYNLHLFHTVQRGFIAQTGDPEGTGRGGESIYAAVFGDQAKYLEAEDTMPKIKHCRRGLLSMVSAGKGLFGSQFFLTLSDAGLEALDGEHCVFGEVAEGWEVVDKLNEVISDDDHRPFQDVRITHTVILDDPFEDPPGLQVPSRSPSPDPERLKTDRLAADADLSADDDLTAEQQAEKAAAKEAAAQATILEMVGDLPEADCAPPENVLFVCKLNPVTTDDDLEIIFSRFGKVVSCEVIRDRKTNDSLQYAFVEFDSPKACETAYFKMDNVLIDDRRIHVDFSQSVSKFKWKGKGRLEVVGEDGGGKGGRGGGGGGRRRSPPRRRRESPPRRRRSRTPERRRWRSPSEESPPRRKRRSRTPEKRRRKSPTPEKKGRSPTPEKKRRSPSPPPRRKRSRTPEKRRRRSRSRSEEKVHKRDRRSRSASKERGSHKKDRRRSRSEERRGGKKERRRSRSASEEKKESKKERRRSRSRSRDRRRRDRSDSREKAYSYKKTSRRSRSRDRRRRRSRS